MLSAFARSDLYRILFGCLRPDLLTATLGNGVALLESDVRRVLRDDGSAIYVVRALIDGEALEGIALLGTLQLMQIDNVSARLRAAPALPEGCVSPRANDLTRLWSRPSMGQMA